MKQFKPNEGNDPKDLLDNLPTCMINDQRKHFIPRGSDEQDHATSNTPAALNQPLTPITTNNNENIVDIYDHEDVDHLRRYYIDKLMDENKKIGQDGIFYVGGEAVQNETNVSDFTRTDKETHHDDRDKGKKW